MVSDIVNVITEWVNAFVTLIIDVFTSLGPIFYDPVAGEVTLVGILALMSVGVGLIYLGLRFILGLFPGAHRL